MVASESGQFDWVKVDSPKHNMDGSKRHKMDSPQKWTAYENGGSKNESQQSTKMQLNSTEKCLGGQNGKKWTVQESVGDQKGMKVDGSKMYESSKERMNVDRPRMLGWSDKHRGNFQNRIGVISKLEIYYIGLG